MKKSIFCAIGLAVIAALACIGCGDNGVSDKNGAADAFLDSFTDPAVTNLNIGINPAGGGIVSRTPNRTTYANGEPVTVTATPNSGYIFTGWTGVSNDTAKSITITMSGDLELTANFISETTPHYTLNINVSPTGYGNVSRDPNKTVYVQGETVKLTATANSGYAFAGWTGTLNGAADTMTVTMNSNVNLTATFITKSTKKYTVTFNANTASGTPPSAIPADSGTAITLPSRGSLTKTGYVFDGWNTKNDGTGTNYNAGSPYTPTADITLYAKWTPAPAGSFTITFNAGSGGTVSPTSGTTDADGKLNEPLPTPTRNGYIFKGWHTAASGGTPIDENTVFSANNTIYAQWTQTYTITFDARGGTVSPTSGTVDEDGKLTETLPTPTDNDRTFKGWYTAITDGTPIGADTVFTANTTIYAQWTVHVTPFTDTRDGTTYKKVKIGTQTWMAENLNYDVPDNETDVCYEENADSCAKYGRLYDWPTAMNEAPSSSNSPSGVQGACPAGWHLPSHDEWLTLASYVDPLHDQTSLLSGSDAGMKLKSSEYWNYTYSNVGTDEYGFSALPGGRADSYDANFYGATGRLGSWWSATAVTNGIYSVVMGNDMDFIMFMAYKDPKPTDKHLVSVRCVEN